ncbi:MAG: carboxypeptidase-like regulatory domain-containing protein [Bacteroidota bacterium]
MKFKEILLSLFCCCFGTLLFGQARATITGIITDADTGEPIDLVDVFIAGTNFNTQSASNGRYSLEVPIDDPLRIIFTRVGYKETPVNIPAMPSGSVRQLDIGLAPQNSDLEVEVRASKILQNGMIREGVEQLKLIPSASGNLESILPSIALGTSAGTGGELSSQYNVRGGNYDENLVYVNDFEIYRPQLIRAGQQEGLSFPNIDLISNLSFSSGGFEARYGDKLSSVLDIKYKRPDSLRGSLGASFLGGSAHLEGSIDVGKDDYQKLRFLVGARYKTTRYLLGTLDIQGEYQPDFSDLQAYVTYDITRDLQLGVLGNYNRAVYNFVPTERNTGFGLINFALQLFSVFEGQERDDFTTAMGGVSLTYIPDRKRNPLFLKLLASTNRSDENEAFDILGQYSLRQIDSDLGSGDFGEVIAELGVGTQQEFVRNFLNTEVNNIEHRGGIEFELYPDGDNVTSSHFLQWSAKYQQENISDNINEWERLDSAGFSLPYDPSQVLLFNTLKTSNDLLESR